MATVANTPESSHGADRLPATMRAVVQRGYGGTDRLRVDEVPLPSPGPEEVLVRVESAGIDRGTVHLMTGEPYVMRLMGFGFRGPRQPVPGLDLAGTVVEVGGDVTRFGVGDQVLGIGSGTLAEYASAPARKLARRPAHLGPEAASVVAVSGLTALQAVRDVGRVEPGQRVLVVGASGGVGTFAVQVARALGASVTGVASAQKLDLVHRLGADRAIDYATEDFADGSASYDLIVDTGGNSRLRRLRRALTPTGTLVIVGGENGGRLIGGVDRQLRALALSPFVGQRLTSLVSKEDQGLEDLVGLIEAGAVTPALERTFSLEEAIAGIRHLQRGDVRGKVAIRVGPR